MRKNHNSLNNPYLHWKRMGVHRFQNLLILIIWCLSKIKFGGKIKYTYITSSIVLMTWNTIIMQLNFYLYFNSNSLVQNHSRINWTIWSVLKNRTFPYYKSGKGQYAFFPVKLSRFDEKNYFLGSSGHPYFMNPFEYGKSFLDKLFLKRFRTLTQTKP